MSIGSLTLVPTPIGNLSDMTFRAIEVLKSVDLILAEDTRKTGLLLKHFEIDNKMQSFHQHNEHKIKGNLIQRLKDGENLAMVTDAGTPGISDPGFLLVRECIEEGIHCTCLPGATALIPALVQSGLPCDRFVFEGFLPVKKGRKTKFESLVGESRTIAFYESPHRLLKTLKELIQYMGGDRKVAVCKEISKLYETTWTGTLEEVLEAIDPAKVKGEFVVVLAGNNG